MNPITPLAPVSLHIKQVSRTSPTGNDDLTKLISLSAEISRSNPLIRRMLRQPDSDASHEQFARFHYLAAFENDNSDDGVRVFMALDTALHKLEAVLGSVSVLRCRIADDGGGDGNAALPDDDDDREGPLPEFIDGEVYRYVLRQAERQRREEMQGVFYVITALDTDPTHVQRTHIRKTLVAFAVAELRKSEPSCNIVAQFAQDADAVDEVYPETVGWQDARRIFRLDEEMLRGVGREGRALKMMVNRGRRGMAVVRRA